MVTTRSRRSFLMLALGAAVVAGAREASAEAVRILAQDGDGTTFALSLQSAPFPAKGASYTDSTVLVFVPRHFRASPGKEVPMLVHFHGHGTTAERAMVTHKLREQLVASRQDAILVVPQGPVNAADSSCGKLESPGGFRALVRDVLVHLDQKAVAKALGTTAFHRAALGRICLSAHSGGYHAAAQCLRHGGVEVNEVYLFDALYADADVFRDWVAEGRGRPQRTRHKLVSYTATGPTEKMNEWLFSELERRGVHCEKERVEGTLSREAITRAEAVLVRTPSAHGAVAFETSALRDCLFASSLPRHLDTTWFQAKAGARPIERMR
ncbi:MAG: hypothetical protein IPK71_35935 [Myxococcales bacterium]|jgi:hypothetical protein|nr:hypothetical protein [Myxococcales bacterium]